MPKVTAWVMSWHGLECVVVTTVAIIHSQSLWNCKCVHLVYRKLLPNWFEQFSASKRVLNSNWSNKILLSQPLTWKLSSAITWPLLKTCPHLLSQRWWQSSLVSYALISVLNCFFYNKVQMFKGASHTVICELTEEFFWVYSDMLYDISKYQHLKV